MKQAIPEIIIEHTRAGLSIAGDFFSKIETGEEIIYVTKAVLISVYNNSYSNLF